MKCMVHTHNDVVTRSGHRLFIPEVPAGSSIAAAVRAALNPPTAAGADVPAWWIAGGRDLAATNLVVNGEVVGAGEAEKRPLEEGDEIRVFPLVEGQRPGLDPGTIFLAAVAVLSTVVSSTLLANSLRTPAASGNDPEEKRFGFARVSNDAFAGDVLPLILGEHPRYGGKVISVIPVEDRPDGNGRLRMLIDLSYGPIAQIGQWTSDVNGVLVDNLTAPGVWLNDDQPINQFKGCKVSVRMGTPDQASIPGFRDTQTLHEVGVGGVELRNTSGTDRTGGSASGEAFTYSSAGPVDQLLLRVRFPRGLLALSNSGQRNARRVQYRYRTRLQAGPGAWSTWTVVTVEKADDSPVVSVQRTADLADPAALVDVQVERITAETDNAGVVDQMMFDQVVEVRKSNNNYPGRALLALELVANEQLQSVPRVSASVKGFAGMRIWDGESDPDDPVFTTGYSDNPAACAMEFLTNSEWGLGNSYGDENVDLASLFEWWVRCDEEIDCLTRDGTRPRHRLALLLNESRYGIDWLRTICNAGNAIPQPAGNRWRFVEDKPRPVAVETFGDGSIAADPDNGVARITYRREATRHGLTRPNQLICQFANELADGRSEPLVYPQDGELWLGDEWEGGAEAQNSQSFKLEGVTDPDQVFARLVLEMKKLRGLGRTISFESSREIVVCQPGDRIDVATSLAGWGLASGRLVAGGSTTITLDRTVTLESGKTYRVYVVHADDSVEVRTIDSPAGTYAAGDPLAVTAAFTSSPAKDEEYALGEVNKELKPFTVTAVRHEVDEDGAISPRIEAIEYDAGVYDPEPGDVTLPDYSSLATIDQAPGPVLSITATERLRNGIRVIDVAWSQAPADRAHTGSFRVYRRSVGSSLWIQITGATVSQAAAVIELGDLDRAYQFIAVAVSPLGAALSPDDPRHPVSTVVYGLSAPPPAAPENPVLTPTGGNTYTLSWDAVDGAVEYQVLAGGDTTALPNTGAEDCLVLARTIDPLLEGLELPPEVECRFWIRAVGASGRLSESAAEISIASPEVPSGSSIKHTEIFDINGSGTTDNAAWDSGDNRLELSSPASPGSWTSGAVDLGSNTITELAIRPATSNDADDFVISSGPFNVPSIAADQWAIVPGSPDYIRMVFPPWPDNEQAWLFEIRTSEDGTLYTDWQGVRFGESLTRLCQFAQVRVTMSRLNAPYRPALRGLTLVATH